MRCFIASLFVLLSLDALSFDALAQDLGPIAVSHAGSAPSGGRCAPGRMVTVMTAGRCCWPAQHWSDDEERCTGIPECPAGFGADGDGCARTDSPAAAASVSTNVSIESHVPRGAVLLPFSHEFNPPDGSRIVRLENRPLKAIGAAVLATAYISAFSVAIAGTGSCGYSYGSCYLGTWVIPVVGPLLSPLVSSPYTDRGGLWAAGVAMSATEFLGAFLFAYGFRRHPYVLVLGERDRSSGREALAGLSVIPVAAGASVGMTLSLQAF